MHHIETAAFARKPAWHGLGNVVPDLMTSGEAQVEGGITWTVRKEPMFIRGPMNEETGKASPIVVPGRTAVALVRSSDNRVLGTATETYEVVQPGECFDFMDNLLAEGVRYEAVGSLMGGALIWLLATLPEPIKIAGDDFKQYAFLSAGMDGTRAIKVAETDTRIVCWNTLNVAWDEAADRILVFRHTRNVKQKMEQAVRTMELMHERKQALVAEAERLLKIPFSQDRYRGLVEQLVPMGEDVTRRVRNNVNEKRSQFYVAIKRDDLANFRDTAWGALQAIADVESHAEPLRKKEGWEERRLVRVVDGGGVLSQAYNILTSIG